MRGKNDTAGIVEVYDIERDSASRLANLSTRSLVQTGNDVLIGGFIMGPNPAGAARIVVRAMGPSFKNQAPTALDDTTLEVHNPNGVLIAENDNWKATQQGAIQGTGLAQTNDAESAIFFPTLAGPVHRDRPRREQHLRSRSGRDLPAAIGERDEKRRYSPVPGRSERRILIVVCKPRSGDFQSPTR